MVLFFRSLRNVREDVLVIYDSFVKNKILFIGVEKWIKEFY